MKGRKTDKDENMSYQHSGNQQYTAHRQSLRSWCPGGPNALCDALVPTHKAIQLSVCVKQVKLWPSACLSCVNCWPLPKISKCMFTAAENEAVNKHMKRNAKVTLQTNSFILTKRIQNIKAESRTFWKGCDCSADLVGTAWQFNWWSN